MRRRLRKTRPPVVIAEHHEVTRWGFESIVEEHDGRIQATARDGLHTIRMVEEYSPRLLVLSLDLPRVHGMEVLRYFQNRILGMEIMVISARDEEEIVTEALKRGVTSYMLKSDSANTLQTAFKATVKGTRTISPGLPDKLLEETDVEEPKPRQYRDFTWRQREVLEYTAEGLTSKEVGEKLNLSRRTIEKHRREIRELLGLDNVVELTRYAVEMGFYKTPPSKWLRDRTSYPSSHVGNDSENDAGDESSDE